MRERFFLMIVCISLLASCASDNDRGSAGSFPPHGGPGFASGGGPSGAPGGPPPGDLQGPPKARAPENVMIAPPQSIAVDRAGGIYVVDPPGNRILRIDTSGIETTIAGTGRKGFAGDGGPAVSAELSNPTSVAIDDSGNLYIADSSNNRVRKVNTAGVISTFAGTGIKGLGGDGGPAVSARLSAPTGLTLDADGNLYIFDGGNNRLCRVAADGTIETVARLRPELRRKDSDSPSL